MPRSRATFPWLTIGGTSVQVGASYDSSVILGKTQAQIAAALSKPNTDIAKGVNGTANVFSQQICKSTNQQPAAVCTAPGVVAAAATLK